MYLGILNLCLDLANIFFAQILLICCAHIWSYIIVNVSVEVLSDVIYTKISRVSVKQITLHNGFIEWTLLNQPVLSASLE